MVMAPVFPDLMTAHQVQLAAESEKERIQRYKSAWDAYYGRMAPSLKETKSDPQARDNVTVAYGRLVVDTVVSWLFGDEPTFSLNDTDDADSPEEQWLDAVWRANKKLLTLQKLGTNGAVCGHTFAKLQQFSPLTNGLPRVVVLDPSNVSVKWSDEDIDVVLEYRIQWTVLDERGKARVRRQRIHPDGPNWLIVDEISKPNGSGYDLIGEERWLHPFAPIAHTQHLPMPNEFYGMSELEEFLLAVNKAINFKYSNANRIERLHAHPRTWGRGFQSKDIDVSPDSTIVLQSKDAELHNLEMQSDGAFAHGNIDRTVEAFFRLARVPLLAIGDVSGISSGLSGVALALYFKPLLQKTETLRLGYGEFLADVNGRLLELGGKGTAAKAQVAVSWPELLPRDPVQERQALQMDVEAFDVSKQTAQEKLGYDYEQERARKEQEDATAAETAARMFDRGVGSLPPGQQDEGEQDDDAQPPR